jgi:hypothetical protein
MGIRQIGNDFVEATGNVERIRIIPRHHPVANFMLLSIGAIPIVAFFARQVSDLSESLLGLMLVLVIFPKNAQNEPCTPANRN